MKPIEPEIQAADPRLRRVLGILLPLLALAALGSLYWMRQHMLELEYEALSSPSDAATGLLVVSIRFFVGLAAVLALFGSWYTVFAWKTLRTERFPPEGMPVARDTPVRRGVGARMRGLIGLFLAVLMLVLALVLPTFGPRLLYEHLIPAFEQSE